MQRKSWVKRVCWLLFTLSAVQGVRITPHTYTYTEYKHESWEGHLQQEFNRLEHFATFQGKQEHYGGGLQDGSLQVNTTTVHKQGQWVRVTWDGIEYGDSEYLTLWNEYNANVMKIAPIKWKKLSKTDFEKGYLDIQMLLMGKERQYFQVMRKGEGDKEATVLAESEPILFLEPREPHGVHLALTSNANEMVIQWSHYSSEMQKVHCRVGEESGSYPMTVEGSSSTYTQEDMCGFPADGFGWVDPGWLNVVVLRGLKPGTRYYYTCGNEYETDKSLWTEEGTFRTPPPASSTEGDVKVDLFVIADMGEWPADAMSDQNLPLLTAPALKTTQLIMKDLDELPEDANKLLIHNGDLSYARGYGSIWNSFFHQIEPLASTIPYMTQIGNHERDWPNSGDRYHVLDSGGECGVPYEKRFTMPVPAPDKHWYSFEFGPFHFLQLSTEHDFLLGSEQHDFVVSDLKKVNRTETPWLIAGFHRPFYIDSTFDELHWSDQVVAEDLRTAFEDLFVEFEVDMTWSGHHHSYQRTCPIYRSKCIQPNEDGIQRAPIHVVLGHAGAGLSNNTSPSAPEYFEIVDLEHGYTKVEATRFNLTMYSMSSSHEGRIIDQFTLKSRH